MTMTRNNVLRATATLMVIIMTMIVLVACGTTPGAQSVEGCTRDGSYGAGCVVEIDYKGKPLYCVTWDGSHGETGLTCDFVEYYGVPTTTETPEGF